uniref:PEP5/VPS11 N-terminal domain-containing protein n=1 Tax=Oncorhynchus tshawytscha TaxID=74940 RepID=A0A8C8IV98_ONCTS
MAAFLQWRRFVFFDRDILPIGISAYKLRVTHLYPLKQHSILVSVGQDVQGVNPLAKVWNLDKRDSRNPLCTRIFPAIPGNKPPEVSCLTVHENLNFMAIGFTDGNMVLTKGDITRDSHSKTLPLHEGTCPATILLFPWSIRTNLLLFHLVLSSPHDSCYTLTVKEYPKLELYTHGCALHCSALTDPYQDSQFIVAGDECVYLYQPDERGSCFAFDGHKLLAYWHRGYLLLLIMNTKSPNKSEFGSRDMSPSEKQTLTIYDLNNKFIAYSASFDDIIEVLAKWGSFYILTRDRKMFVMQEKDTQTKLEMLFKKNLFVMSINLANSQHLDRDGLCEIFRYSESEVQFDVEIAIKVLRQAGYHSHAVFLAERHQDHEWYLKIQLEDLKNYEEALCYIGRLPFEQSESNMKRYGKTLIHHVPDGTTLHLKGLCTDYQPSWDTTDRDSLDRGSVANSEEFIPVFANNPQELRAFLEHIIKVEPFFSQGVYDTLLVLRLQDWAHEQDPEVMETHTHGAALSLLRSDNTVFDKALVLCQMHNFKEGVLYLYEKGKLYQQIMHYHMQNEEYGKVVEACSQRYGDQEVCLWEQTLGYFARKEENCKAYISQVLQHIDQNNLLPPLLDAGTQLHGYAVLINKLQRETQQIEDDERKIRQYREETAHLRTEIQELRSSAKIFQKPKCSMCNSPLELPSVHFLCSHSFKQVECSTCTPENRKVMEMLHAQDQKRDLHDHFTRQGEMAPGPDPGLYTKMTVFTADTVCCELYQIKMYLSHALNTTGVDITVKCLLTGSNQWCGEERYMCVCVCVCR